MYTFAASQPLGTGGCVIGSSSSSSSRSSLNTQTHARPRRYRSTAPPQMIRGFPNNFGGTSGLGGGAGANDGSRIFDELVDFPCVFTFKVIGERQGDFMNDIVDSVASTLQTDRKNLKTSFRDRGKYRSITLRAPVSTGAQIYSVYAAIDRDPRVKFKF